MAHIWDPAGIIRAIFRILSFTRGIHFSLVKNLFGYYNCNNQFISSSSLYMSNTAKLLVLGTAKTTKTTKTAKTSKIAKKWKALAANWICQTLSCRSSIFSCIVNCYVKRQVQPYTLFLRDCRFSCDNIRSFWWKFVWMCKLNFHKI